MTLRATLILVAACFTFAVTQDPPPIFLPPSPLSEAEATKPASPAGDIKTTRKLPDVSGNAANNSSADIVTSNISKNVTETSVQETNSTFETENITSDLDLDVANSNLTAIGNLTENLKQGVNVSIDNITSNSFTEAGSTNITDINTFTENVTYIPSTIFENVTRVTPDVLNATNNVSTIEMTTISQNELLLNTTITKQITTVSNIVSTNASSEAGAANPDDLSPPPIDFEMGEVIDIRNSKQITTVPSIVTTNASSETGAANIGDLSLPPIDLEMGEVIDIRTSKAENKTVYENATGVIDNVDTFETEKGVQIIDKADANVTKNVTSELETALNITTLKTNDTIFLSEGFNMNDTGTEEEVTTATKDKENAILSLNKFHTPVDVPLLPFDVPPIFDDMGPTLDNNSRTISSLGNVSKLPVDVVESPSVLFNEEPGSTTIEISDLMFGEFGGFGAITGDNATQKSKNTTLNDLPSTTFEVTTDETFIADSTTASFIDKKKKDQVDVTRLPRTTSIPKTPRPSEKRDQQKDSVSKASQTDTVISPDHPPPIFSGGSRPTVYTDEFGPHPGYFPSPELPPKRQQKGMSTTTAPPPPIFVPKEPTKGHRLLVPSNELTTPAPPNWIAEIQAKQSADKVNPRYMNVAELAAYTLEISKQNKTRTGVQYLFPTEPPTTVAPTQPAKKTTHRSSQSNNPLDNPQRDVNQDQSKFSNAFVEYLREKYGVNNVVQTTAKPFWRSKPTPASRQFFDSQYLLSHLSDLQTSTKRPATKAFFDSNYLLSHLSELGSKQVGQYMPTTTVKPTSRTFYTENYLLANLNEFQKQKHPSPAIQDILIQQQQQQQQHLQQQQRSHDVTNTDTKNLLANLNEFQKQKHPSPAIQNILIQQQQQHQEQHQQQQQLQQQNQQQQQRSHDVTNTDTSRQSTRPISQQTLPNWLTNMNLKSIGQSDESTSKTQHINSQLILKEQRKGQEDIRPINLQMQIKPQSVTTPYDPNPERNVRMNIHLKPNINQWMETPQMNVPMGLNEQSADEAINRGSYTASFQPVVYGSKTIQTAQRDTSQSLKERFNRKWYNPLEASSKTIDTFQGSVSPKRDIQIQIDGLTQLQSTENIDIQASQLEEQRRRLLEQESMLRMKQQMLQQQQDLLRQKQQQELLYRQQQMFSEQQQIKNQAEMEHALQVRLLLEKQQQLERLEAERILRQTEQLNTLPRSEFDRFKLASVIGQSDTQPLSQPNRRPQRHLNQPQPQVQLSSIHIFRAPALMKTRTQEKHSQTGSHWNVQERHLQTGPPQTHWKSPSDLAHLHGHISVPYDVQPDMLVQAQATPTTSLPILRTTPPTKAYIPVIVTTPKPRIITTSPRPTPPVTADPNPPPIFDIKIRHTFMPMPKIERTTKGPKMNNSVDETMQFGPNYDARCRGCVFVNDRCLLPDVVHCNIFTECVKQGSSVRAFSRECAIGSFFDRKSFLCVDPKNADCPTDRCRIPGTKWYPVHGHCKHYWACGTREGGAAFAQSECCPEMGGFLESEGCVENPNCTETCNTAIVMEAPQGCQLRKTAKPAVYFDGNANIERPCAPGTLFNETVCTCVQDVKVERSETRGLMNCTCSNETTCSCSDALQATPNAAGFCSPMLAITFAGGRMEDSSNTKQHLGVEGISVTGHGEAIYKGNGRLIAWRYANLMFPMVFAIQFRFFSTSPEPRYQTIFSNCDSKDKQEPSIEISLDTMYHEVIFKVDTYKGTAKRFTIIYQQNTWTTVDLIYDGERIVGAVDRRARNIFAGGGIETRPNPISIGSCEGKDGLKGLLDDVFVYEDCIPDEMYGIFMSVLE